jgi:hypothetical protein
MKRLKKIKNLSLLVIIFLHFQPIAAEEPLVTDTNHQLSFENHRLSFDLNSILQESTQDASSWGWWNEIGVDYYKKIRVGNRDVAKVLLQVNWATLDNYPRPPGFFEGMDDGGELVLRNNYIDFSLDNLNKFNLKIGKFELPYGLETSVATQKELRQVLTVKNIGVKADWGVEFHGLFEKYKYQVAIMRGSGSDVTSLNLPRISLPGHIVSARFGTISGSESIYGGENGYGASFFNASIPVGELSDNKELWRIGLDGQSYRGPFGVLAELNYGQDGNIDIFNAFVESNYVTPVESLLVYSQFRTLSRKVISWDDSNSVALGVRYEISRNFTLSAQWNRSINDSESQSVGDFWTIQSRWRF